MHVDTDPEQRFGRSSSTPSSRRLYVRRGGGTGGTPLPSLRLLVAMVAICTCLVLMLLARQAGSASEGEDAKIVIDAALMSSSVSPLEGDQVRSVLSLDGGWKFFKESPQTNCTDADFPIDLKGVRCYGLTVQLQVTDAQACQATCCADDQCEVWQWCLDGSTTCSPGHCYTGKKHTCEKSKEWVSRARVLPAPAPPPAPGSPCQHDFCRPSYDDKDWQNVKVPHDMLLDDSHFSPYADKVHGYVPYCRGWYRLHFNVPSAALHGKALRLDFDGVQRDSAVYLNGKVLGSHLSGYTPFGYDVTGLIAPDTDNLVAVKVDATRPDGWWYDGGGIYRHVWLTITEPVHIMKWGVYLPALVTGGISEDLHADAVVKSRTTVVNSGSADIEVQLMHHIRDPSGKDVATAKSKQSVLVKAKTNATVRIDINLSKASLWSDASPMVYTCTTELYEAKLTGGEDLGAASLLDEVKNTFGVRKAEWDVNKGFFLNSRPTKIKGFANHQDFAGVGVAVPDSMQGYRVKMVQSMGANAWRTAHNPPTTTLLDECDRRGMLVWDENHRNRATPDMVEDLKTMILRDRNHPSIVMWSLCNEALCENFNATAAKILVPIFKALDPDGQRPVTAAINALHGEAKDFRALLDVVGINYQHRNYDTYRKEYPNQPLIGSETSSDFSDRSIYSNDPNKSKYVSAYDINFPPWGATAEDAWCSIAERSFMAGGFYWTAFDYKGEPTPYGWPNVNSHFGVIDITGFPKDNFHYHRSVFLPHDKAPMVHILPHWNWDQAKCLNDTTCHYNAGGQKIISVWAYSNAPHVELFLNDKSLGKKDVPTCRHAEWLVPFTPGTLLAKAYSEDGSEVATVNVTTTGPAVATAMVVEWPGKDAVVQPGDVYLVAAQLVDSKQRVVPTASTMLNFSVTGDAEIIGLGNGDPSSHELDKPATPTAGSRSAWNGLARVIVQIGSSRQPFDLHVASSKGGMLKSSRLQFVPKVADDDVHTEIV